MAARSPGMTVSAASAAGSLEGRQVRRIAGARPDVAQVGVPSRPLGGGRADEGDDVVGQGVGGDSEDGVADESVQSPPVGRVVG